MLYSSYSPLYRFIEWQATYNLSTAGTGLAIAAASLLIALAFQFIAHGRTRPLTWIAAALGASYGIAAGLALAGIWPLAILFAAMGGTVHFRHDRRVFEAKEPSPRPALRKSTLLRTA